jgi:hypothetical protein
MTEKAELVGSVVRAYLDDLRSIGALDAIRPRLSPQAAQMMEKPPLPVSWVEINLAHEPLVALAALRGRDEVRALGHRVVRGTLGSVIRPLLTTTLALFGGTPATLFSRMDTLTAVMLRGVKFSWTSGSSNGGTVAIDHPYPVDTAVFAAWEGVLHIAYDLAKLPGTVREARVVDGGNRGEIDVSW